MRIGKARRILSIYSKLLQGEVVDKIEESAAFEVSERTIERDIKDIKCFLADQRNDSSEEKNVDFDQKCGGHRLKESNNDRLDAKELLVICKVLLESRSLVKEEIFPIIEKLQNICSPKVENELLKDFIINEMFHYIQLRHGKKLLDDIWKLEEAVKYKKYLVIRYKKLDDKEVRRKVRPVGVMFSEFYFYLTAYIEDIDRENAFQNPEDPFPTIYRVDRLIEINVLDERFPYLDRERFQEGEFRKRIQFMYGGRLRKIKFKYKGNSPDFIMDKLPTAEKKSEDSTGITFEAEVFGDGFDRWVRSQGDDISDIEIRFL